MTSPSDAPVRAAGSHTRSGNAMARTRAAILDAAERCLADTGVRRTTMGDVSAAAAIAKATLYNHFRTKDDLLAGLVQSRLEQLTGECTELAAAGLEPALAHAARSLASNPALRRVAAEEPAVLAMLAVPSEGRAWVTAHRGVETVLRESGAPHDPATVDVVVRWLAGHLLWAAGNDEIARGAGALAAGLSRAPVVVHEPPSRPAPAGVGWPI